MNIKVIPGNVVNNGIKDVSRKKTAPKLPTYPAHFPVLSVVTPKGQLGQKYINIDDFVDLYGDITDVDSPYFNPIADLIANMAEGGQASIGIRRLTANTERARWIHGIKVTIGEVPQYLRSNDGQFKLDSDGKLQIDPDATPVTEGIILEDVIMEANGQAFGKVAQITVNNEDDTTSTIYPIQELETDIGDVYNRSGIMAGIAADDDFSTISAFVSSKGVYPFKLKMYEKTTAGTPVFVKTLTDSESATYTLFDCKDTDTGVRYGLGRGLAAFTGDSTTTAKIPAPFSKAFVYTANLETITRLMYNAESEYAPDNLVYLEGVAYNRQMNPLTAVNHEGIPYYTIVKTGSTRWFNLNSAMDAKGGISPFLTKDYKPFVKVKGNYNFDPANGQVDQLSTEDAWTISQALILADVISYRKSLTITDLVRNRQSIIYDVGYNSDIKDELIELLNARKDHVAAFQASYWLADNTIEERYSIANALSAKLKLKPESTKHGTPASRATIFLWDAYMTGSESDLPAPTVLDLAHKMAQFGGAASGMLNAAYCPDHSDNRHLTTMHTPNIDLESDPNGANNFVIGATTLRPRDQNGLFYRPALPTVYPYGDSVLKDWITNFVAICHEKVIQDAWPEVCGSTVLSESEYAATVKDLATEACQSRFGTMTRGVRIDATYDETSSEGREVMQTSGYILFNKGKYMMEMEVVAGNEADGFLDEQS